MTKVVRIIAVMVMMDMLAAYAMYVMMSYLTNVWKIGFTHAAAIVNIFWGIVYLSPFVLSFVANTFTGNYWMLLLSSFSCSAGLGILTMSTPPVLANSMGNCSEYRPECIGEGQKVLFYTAMPLIAFGMGGHFTCWNIFMVEQSDGAEYIIIDKRTFVGISAFTVVTFVAVLGLPYVKPWSLRFGIPAICTLFATLLFLSGSCSYKYVKPTGSPYTMFFQVFAAVVCKLFYSFPADDTELYEARNVQLHRVSHTSSLRWLDKAAIVIPTQTLDEQWWRLCRVTRVEETKAVVRTIPVWLTFILCGVVSATPLTYFVAQLDHMNPKVGRVKVHIVVFIMPYIIFVNVCGRCYRKVTKSFSGSRLQMSSFVGIITSMIIGILCFITAAKVESRRLGVVRSHGLVDKPDETVPMNMFWLLPQFLLAGIFEGILKKSVVLFFKDNIPVFMEKFLPHLVDCVYGVGFMGNILSVHVLGKISERGGKMNWFQLDINQSRVDKYYWTLSWLMAVNLVMFVVAAISYCVKELDVKKEQAAAAAAVQSAGGGIRFIHLVNLVNSQSRL
ncbi:hypothetical protein ABFS82_10G019200 [Erythranthe guttata]